MEGTCKNFTPVRFKFACLDWSGKILEHFQPKEQFEQRTSELSGWVYLIIHYLQLFIGINRYTIQQKPERKKNVLWEIYLVLCLTVRPGYQQKIWFVLSREKCRYLVTLNHDSLFLGDYCLIKSGCKLVNLLAWRPPLLLLPYIETVIHCNAVATLPENTH